MKKWILVLALLFGCGTPCDDLLTEFEQDAALTLIALARDQGTPASEFLAASLFNCQIVGCRECVSWMVDMVYGE